jgi:hypothetical protein
MLHCLGRYYPSLSILVTFFVSFSFKDLFIAFDFDNCLFFRFKHPHSGKALEFSCPPPDDFTEVLDELRRITPTSDGDSDGVAQLSD